MYEANNTNFKPADGELPNTMLRFGIESIKSKSTFFSNSGEFNVLAAAIFFTFLAVGLYLYSQNQDEDQEMAKLSRTSEKVNQAKSQLMLGMDSKNSDVGARDRSRKESEVNILADYEAKLRQESQNESRGIRSKLSRKSSADERRLKKLAPDLSAINPDQE
jgi:negative regulator of sigma E activity